MLASALVPEKLSAIRSVRYWEVFKVQYIWETQLVHAHCPLYGRCPLFGVSAKRGSTVYTTVEIKDGVKWRSLLSCSCPYWRIFTVLFVVVS